jgi:pimeloyl-ACP methyl ester carboxylesterase
MKTSRITIAGGQIEVLDLAGDDGSPPLVLLHEGLGAVRLWKDFPEELADKTGARVVVFSRFGHGNSDPPARPRTPSFMHDEAFEVLPQILDQLSIVNPLLIGHSDGASIALLYAAAHPVHALVAMAPHVFVEQVCLEEIRSVKQEYEHGDLRARMARRHRDPDAAFYGWNDVWLHPDFTHWNIEDSLPAIGCPVLLIQGTRDQYGTMAQLDAVERAVRGPVRRVHLDCGHSLHREAEAETVEAISRFVAGVTSQNPPASLTHAAEPGTS